MNKVKYDQKELTVGSSVYGYTFFNEINCDVSFLSQSTIGMIFLIDYFDRNFFFYARWAFFLIGHVKANPLFCPFVKIVLTKTCIIHVLFIVHNILIDNRNIYANL